MELCASSSQSRSPAASPPASSCSGGRSCSRTWTRSRRGSSAALPGPSCFELLLLALVPFERALWETAHGERISRRVGSAGTRLHSGSHRRRMGRLSAVATLALAVPVVLVDGRAQRADARPRRGEAGEGRPGDQGGPPGDREEGRPARSDLRTARGNHAPRRRPRPPPCRPASRRSRPRGRAAPSWAAPPQCSDTAPPGRRRRPRRRAARAARATRAEAPRRRPSGSAA